MSIVGQSAAEFEKRLRVALTGKKSLWTSQGTASPQKPKIAFLFTGQGSQHVAMGKQLYQTSATFRTVIDQCDTILRPYLAHRLLDILGYREDAQGEDAELVNHTAYAQPALFAVEYALRLWCADQKWRYVFSLYSIIDAIAIAPILPQIDFPIAFSQYFLGKIAGEVAKALVDFHQVSLFQGGDCHGCGAATKSFGKFFFGKAQG